jgi:hypothetical protein
MLPNWNHHWQRQRSPELLQRLHVARDAATPVQRPQQGRTESRSCHGASGQLQRSISDYCKQKEQAAERNRIQFKRMHRSLVHCRPEAVLR